MRTLCPNLDNEDALETVLEVPIPEESFDDIKINNNITSWQAMKSWMKPHSFDQKRDFGGRNAEIQLLLGAPLVPLSISSPHSTITKQPIQDHPIGLDPKSTANLFTNSICLGEKTIKGEDCFVLKLEAELSTLKVRSSNNVEIMKHTIWGYFSQRTGLLYQPKDSHLIRIKTPESSDCVFWETTMESVVQDYRMP